MAGETILIIDADEATEQKIMTALEAKGYLVFTASSQVLNAETLEKLGPSLIYIAPLATGTARIETCKAIHGNPSLKQVPIVLLEGSDPALNLQNLTGYGVVDFLKPTFGSDELIKKTETILGRTPPSHLHEGNGWGAGKPAEAPGPTRRTDAPADDPQVNEWESIDRALSEKHKKTVLGEPWDDVEEIQGETLKDEPLPSERVGETEKKRSALLRPAIGAAIFVVVVGVGLLLYQQFTPTRKVWPVRPVSTPSPAPPKLRDTRPASEVPPAKIDADAPSPASPASQAPVSQASASPAPAPAVPAPSGPPSTGLPQALSVPPRAAPQPPLKPFYAVQIGAYKDETNAHDLTKAFLEKGYDAFIQPGVTKDKSPIYRVLVGKSEDKKAARRLAEEIRSKEKIETTLFGE